MNTVLDDKQMKSLALGIARGRSVWSWARRHAVDFTTAYDWSIQNENRELVDVARMRVADRLVGRLVGAAKLAIDQLVRLCTRSASDTVRLSASRALLHWWFKASELFDMYGKLRDTGEASHEGRKPEKIRRVAPRSAVHAGRRTRVRAVTGRESAVRAEMLPAVETGQGGLASPANWRRRDYPPFPCEPC